MDTCRRSKKLLQNDLQRLVVAVVLRVLHLCSYCSCYNWQQWKWICSNDTREYLLNFFQKMYFNELCRTCKVSIGAAVWYQPSGNLTLWKAEVRQKIHLLVDLNEQLILLTKKTRDNFPQRNLTRFLSSKGLCSRSSFAWRKAFERNFWLATFPRMVQCKYIFR